jgi:hypothetical protein
MAAFLAAEGKVWNCAECIEQGLQTSRFCHEDAPFPIFTIDGEDFLRCPVQFISQESFEALALFTYYQDGFLPEAGGIFDQPNLTIAQIRTVKHAVQEQAEEIRRRKKL